MGMFIEDVNLFVNEVESVSSWSFEVESGD